MILVAGEALYDLVVQGDGDDLRGHPGGGPFNTARTVGRLGQPVAYLGRVSSDRFGRRLEALLSDDGVALGSVVRTDEPTTLAIAEVDHEGVARYRFYERGTAATGLTPEAALDALPRHRGRPARRHARARARAGRDGAGGGRRAGRRQRADRGRPQLPAMGDRGPGRLPLAPRPRARACPSAEGQRGGHRVPRAGPLAGRGRARAARARPGRRPAHARPERRARDHPHRRGRGPGAACQGGRHDRRR